MLIHCIHSKVKLQKAQTIVDNGQPCLSINTQAESSLHFVILLLLPKSVKTMWCVCIYIYIYIYTYISYKLLPKRFRKKKKIILLTLLLTHQVVQIIQKRWLFKKQLSIVNCIYIVRTKAHTQNQGYDTNVIFKYSQPGTESIFLVVEAFYYIPSTH